jgi:serine/threonine protein kinase
VLRLFQAYEHKKNLHIVVELCSGGNLLRVLNNQPRRRVSELQAAQFSMQILRAINYMHENDIVHRDVKLEVRATINLPFQLLPPPFQLFPCPPLPVL